MNSNWKALLAACLAATVSAVGADEETGPRKQAAEQTAAAFIKELGGALKAQLAEGGPVAAISVCKDIAPALANRYSLQNGWKVTRVGTRVRNPMIGMPDAWEQAVLARFEERTRRGEEPAEISFSEVVSEPGGQYFRYMKAIGVSPPCLSCHGDPQAIPGAVREQLQAEYPHDRALGYQVEELRGAISIKQPMDVAGVSSAP